MRHASYLEKTIGGSVRLLIGEASKRSMLNTGSVNNGDLLRCALRRITG